MNKRDKKKLSKTKIEKYNDLIYIIAVCACVTAVLLVSWSFTGQWPWRGHAYNSYVLQARSWLSGRLDLGQNYEHLELAVFDGRYFVSFPPFPSYVMLPFVMLGWNTCDGAIAFLFSLAGAVYAYKIFRHFKADEKKSVLFALFLTVGSNWLLTAQNAWVWFIAQNMAFTLCLAAIYYALKNKAGLSLALWACAVGCRPFTAIFIPVLVYLLYKAHKADNPHDRFSDFVRRHILSPIPMLVIAVSYMALNYARFGNIAEFGHNYLPEHTRSQFGQFHYTYMVENLKNLFRLPSVGENGRLVFPKFNGMCIFIASPIFVSYIVYTVRSLVKREQSDKAVMIMTAVLTAAYIALLTAHATMGGSHFGNRYTNDVLPFVFLGIAALVKKKNGIADIAAMPLFMIGLCLNLLGSVMFYNNLL